MLYSCRYYLYQLFFPFKNLCGRVFCNTFIHGDAPQFEKKVSTFEQSECIIWIFSTTSSVKDNVLWMKCNFYVAFKKWVCFKILLRDIRSVCSLGRTNKFLDNMVVFKILEIDHIDCEKFMFIYQQNGSHLGNSSLHYVSHLGSMIFQ